MCVEIVLETQALGNQLLRPTRRSETHLSHRLTCHFESSSNEAPCKNAVEMSQVKSFQLLCAAALTISL